MYAVTIIITKLLYVYVRRMVESVETCETNSRFRRERKRKLEEEARADK